MSVPLPAAVNLAAIKAVVTASIKDAAGKCHAGDADVSVRGAGIRKRDG